VKDARVTAIRTHLEIHAKPAPEALAGVRSAFERAVRELAKPEPDAIWLAEEPCLACWLGGEHVFRVLGRPGAWSITARPLADRWRISLDVKPDGTHWVFADHDEEFVTVTVGQEEEQKHSGLLTATEFARLLSSQIGSPFGPAPLRKPARRRRWGRG
jgi:hypothetical protein